MGLPKKPYLYPQLTIHSEAKAIKKLLNNESPLIHKKSF